MLSPELLERGALELGFVARLLGREPERLACSPHSFFARVERIHLCLAPPPEVRPLASEGAWYVGPRSLHCVVASELEALATLERLVEVFSPPELEAGSALAAPALVVELEPALLPSALRAAGAEIAEAWLSASAAPLEVALCERALGLSVLSPYPVDLGATLRALALQSPALRPHEGWLEALSGPLDRDQAAVLAEHLVGARPELLPERRAGEAAVGLSLEDRPLVVHGQFRGGLWDGLDPDLAALAEPGRSLHLASSRSPLLLAALVSSLLSARRVASLAAAFEDAGAPEEVFTARVFALSDDALGPSGCDPVSEALIDQDVDSRSTFTPSAGEWGLPIRLLRLTRRASALGAPFEIGAGQLVGHRSWELCRDDPREARAPLRAFRAALRAQSRGFTLRKGAHSRARSIGLAPRK